MYRVVSVMPESMKTIILYEGGSYDEAYSKITSVVYQLQGYTMYGERLTCKCFVDVVDSFNGSELHYDIKAGEMMVYRIYLVRV